MPALFLSYSGLLGGGERLLLDAASAFDEPPTLECPEGPLAGRARAEGLHVIALRERPLELRGGGAARRAAAATNLAGFRRDAKRLVDALDPDVVFAWGMRAGLAASGLGRRTVFQHNDLMPGPAIARAVRAAARRADVVVAASDCIARELDAPGVQVIHPGVALDHFRALPPPSGPAEVLVLGAIEPWKRPDFALEVVAAAARSRDDIRLRICGEPIGPAGERLVAQLMARAEEPDLARRVELAGRADAAEALARAHCLLHCADREPYGMVLVEALASARAVVAPAACGPLEIVDDGCGRLYPPGDVEAAATALLEVLDRAAELGAAGRQRAERHFDVRETRESYRRLIPSPSRTRTPGAGAGLPAFVTVTHNSATDLQRLLASVRAHLPDAPVIVVDTGSTDPSAAVARDAGAHVIELGENVGFGRACNIGVAAAQSDLTVLVNPDVELVDASLASLAADLRLSDRILAPLVLRPDGSRQDVAQAEPGSPAAATIALIPPAAMPVPLRHAACPWTARAPRRVGWAVGCCLVARTATLERLGPFDERIFMYGEDLELGLRASQEGVETWFRPDARVIHHGAHSTGPAFGGEPFELLADQRRRVLAERRGRSAARRDDLLQALTFAERIALKTVARRSTERERKQLKALWRRR